MTDQPTVRSINHLDLNRYLGQWFEIGRLPLKWEEEGATDVTAHYSLDADGDIEVDNRCVNEKGEATQSIGRAKQVGEKTSELSVSFLPELLRWIPFTEGDYWVLRIDDDYQHALVGTPDHKNLWLLAREHKISPDIEQSFRDTATSMGFDLSEWIRPTQTGHTVTDDLLK